MTSNTPRNPAPSRAHVSGACPVCHGAGKLPSMTMAGLTNPCPRCLHALRLPSDAAEKPEPIRLAGDPPARRHDDEAPSPGFLVLLAGIACGFVFGALVAGLFRVFG